jgi:hypothetical protein
MPGPPQVGGTCAGTGQRTNGRGPVGGGDAGTHVAVIDADGERGAVTLGVLLDHERQFKLISALVRHRRADDSAAVPQEERHLLSAHQRGRGAQVALVLPLPVVGDHDHPARSQSLDCGPDPSLDCLPRRAGSHVSSGHQMRLMLSSTGGASSVSRTVAAVFTRISICLRI